MLVTRHVSYRHELLAEVGGCPTLVRLQRERVLLLARDAVALGDVLTGLAHRLEREHLLHLRIREAPPQMRVVHDLIPAWKCLVRLRDDERRARHRLDTARDEEIPVAYLHRVTGADDRRQPGRTQS